MTKKSGNQFRKRLVSLKQFRSSHRRLRRLYYITDYAYELTGNEIEKRLSEGRLRAREPVVVRGHRLARSPHELPRRLRSTYLSLLRQTLFIALIAAFETFLIDTIAEVFRRSKGPFKYDRELRFTQEHLLSFTSLDDLHDFLITSECRRLTGSGFGSINDFFKNRMGILIPYTTDGSNTIGEMYERRHLFVHSAGRIDEKYRRRFDPQGELGKVLSISHEYLEEAFETTRKAALQVSRQVRKKWPVESL